MAIDVTMPKLSDTMEEGKILRWLKAIGEQVAVGDVIAEVETDKADMEMEAFDAGVLTEIRTPEGTSVPVGAVIAVLAEAGAAAKPRPAPSPVSAAPAVTAAADPSPPGVPVRAASAARPQEPLRRAEAPPVAAIAGGGRVKASPLARRIADAQGVELERVRGTGPGGRVVQKDVEAAAATAPRLAPAAAATPARHPAPSGAAPAAAVGERRELSRIQKATARRMTEAKRDVPHFYATSEIGMDEVVRLKAELALVGGEFQGITYTHILLRALGLALRRVPEVNASYDQDAVVLHGAVNIGLATATDDGLMVPVVRACDTNSLGVLVPQVNALIARTRSGRFAAADLSGGTFTLSNLGMFPVADFAAIVNPPQAAILAVGAIREVPVVRGGGIAAGRVMQATLSCDHRAVDGALAGRFLRELVALLEHPVALLV